MMVEQELRERLGAVDAPPSRLSTESALTAGRRASRRRASLSGAGAVLAVGALVAVPSLVLGGTPDVSPAGPVPKSCPATSLPVPAGMKNVQVNAVDPTGRFIVAMNISKQAQATSAEGKIDELPEAEPVMWTDGRVQVLPAPASAVRLNAVNAAGVAVAVAGDDKVWDTVLRYVDGVPERLTLPAGKWSLSPLAFVNAAGDIAVSDEKLGVVFWKSGTTAGVKLPLPRGVTVRHLADDGRIIGEVVSADRRTLTTYVWNQSGAGTKFAAPDGQTMSVSAARGEWATGNLWPSGTVARWNLRTGQVTDLLLGTPANAINAQGWILADDTVQRDDTTVTLQQIAGDKEPAFPTALSDTGLVVGSRLTYDKSSNTVSNGVVAWNCADAAGK